MGDNYWDDEAYIRITGATYDPTRDVATVAFADGDSVAVAAWRLLGRGDRHPDWTRLEVVDGYHITVPVAAGMGDLGTDEVDIPGLAIRSITDPIFTAHLARAAEESARRVGARLTELRLARGFTAQQVAERSGMAQQHISRLEQGRYAVSYATLEKVLAAMGYSPRDVTVGADAPASAAP